MSLTPGATSSNLVKQLSHVVAIRSLPFATWWTILSHFSPHLTLSTNSTYNIEKRLIDLVDQITCSNILLGKESLSANFQRNDTSYALWDLSEGRACPAWLVECCSGAIINDDITKHMLHALESGARERRSGWWYCHDCFFAEG